MEWRLEVPMKRLSWQRKELFEEVLILTSSWLEFEK